MFVCGICLKLKRTGFAGGIKESRVVIPLMFETWTTGRKVLPFTQVGNGGRASVSGDKTDSILGMLNMRCRACNI